MSAHCEVRFHLQKGRNYMKWQVKVMQGSKKIRVRYYDPSELQLEMRGCRLVNKIGKAKKVHAAGKKDVSGWIKCSEVLFSEVPVGGLEKVYYNPIRDVHWRREGDAGEFAWDGTKYATMVTQGRQVYILEEHEGCEDES